MKLLLHLTQFFGNGLKSICEDFRPSQTGFEGRLSPPPCFKAQLAATVWEISPRSF